MIRLWHLAGAVADCILRRSVQPSELDAQAVAEWTEMVESASVYQFNSNSQQDRAA